MEWDNLQGIKASIFVKVNKKLSHKKRIQVIYGFVL